LEVTGRGSVHIEGIGSIKANEILDWKKAIESRYRGQMPHSIPQDHLKRIKMKYDAQRKTISEKERIARLEAEQKIELVKHKHRLEKETLTNKMSAIRKQHLDKISLINKQIEKRNMALSEINFEFGKKQYEIKNFRHINIGNYLKRIIH
jgi:DNA-binding helix-hairpin-helix protein with protein kinase domain